MSFPNQLYLDAPVVGQTEKEYLCQAIDSGFVSTIGPFVPEFEEKFAKYLGLPKVVSVQSGTAALHLALLELGIGPGDEVIVPALTFIATINPILYIGATPVIVDVDLDTWNISVASIQKAITPKTKALMPVHLYGTPCDMDEILQLASQHHLVVIEDATESLGARYKGSYTGTLGDLGAFSFNGNKTMTTGGGGMVSGKNESQLAHIKFLANQAREESKGYYHPEVGYNYRMTNIEAALGLAQFAQFSDFLVKKKRLNEIYREQLSADERIIFQKVKDGVESSYWFSALRFPQLEDVAELQNKLKNQNLPSRRNFVPLQHMPPYKQYSNSTYPNADLLYATGLCLPSSCLNDEESVKYFCKVLKELL